MIFNQQTTISDKEHRIKIDIYWVSSQDSMSALLDNVRPSFLPSVWVVNGRLRIRRNFDELRDWLRRKNVAPELVDKTIEVLDKGRNNDPFMQIWVEPVRSITYLTKI